MARRIGFFFSLLAVVLVGVSCGNSITGSGRIVTRRFSLSPFTGVDAESAFEVHVRIGEVQSVVVRLDSTLADGLDVRVSARELHVGLRPHISIGNAKLQADVVMTKLTGVRAGGASKVLLDQTVDCDRIDINLSGASRFEGGLQAGGVFMDLTGASQLDLHGVGARVTVKASGASQLHLQDLHVGTLSINLSGASQAQVSVQDTIAADLSGASQLTYRGHPRFTKQLTSGASIIRSE
jgi:hypothetical protein